MCLILLPYFFYIFFYIFHTHHFGSKIIISLGIASTAFNIFRLWLTFSICYKSTQCFKTNILTLITPEQKRRVRMGVEGGEGFDFSMLSIFWNILFTGKNLPKQTKFFVHQIRIWHLGVLTIQKFNNIALLIFKIFKMVTPTTFPK